MSDTGGPDVQEDENVLAGYRWRAAATAAFAAFVTGCSGGSAPVAVSPAPSSPAASPSPSSAPTVDPASVKANELGRVPVLMYHQVVGVPKGVYDQTPAQFRGELDLLYRSGYRTVTAADLVAGRVDLPAGRSPMVLTFDDSTTSQYRTLADGTLDPTCAVGILLAVAKRYGEDRPVATFYVNADPFAGATGALQALQDLGMELGEHTATHANLRKLSDAGVQSELRAGLKAITDEVPAAEVTTMALPFGAHPATAGLEHRGSGYSFAGVMLVGSGPARSPYDKDFDPLGVPRIRSGLRTGDQLFTSTYWLPKLLATRYVSDGDPATVSFPRAAAGDLDPRLASRARPY